MSGIGDSLADLDKGVRKSVPGGWGTVAGLAAGGTGLYYGLGAGAAGAAGSAGASGLTASAVPLSTSGLAVGSGSALAGTGAGAAATAGTAAGTAAGSLGSTGWIAPTIGGTASTGFGISAGAAPVAGQALTASAAAAVPGSAEAIYNAQTASSLFGGSNPFKISPTQAMMASRMMGSQQPQGGETRASAPFKAGQPVNTADPIMALLAPKMKKKERISLL